MARTHHASHAREYAALKARAQAAGMSVRAFKAARKQSPDTYYAPRAVTTVQRRIARGDDKKTARLFGAKYSDQLYAEALIARGADPNTIDTTLRERKKHTTADERRQAVNYYREFVDDPGPDGFYIPYDDYEKIGHALWYH